MSDIFISHAEEDRELADRIAERLEEAGYTTWSYRTDDVPGVNFISQITQAIDESKTIILIISPHAMKSQYVETELFHAFDQNKRIIPLLVGIKWDEVKKRKRNWAALLGPRVAIEISLASVDKVMPRVLKSLKKRSPTRTAPQPQRRWPKMIETVIVFIISIAAIAGALYFYNYMKPIKFADSTLESVIAESLNVPVGKVRQANLDGLSYLNADSEDISILEGIEHCSNLETLQLSHCQIADISPLSGLTKLTDLELDGNQINDIWALSYLINLQTLKLNSNSISDISVLSGLTNLQTIHLEYNQISDISALVSNPGLSSGDIIYLSSNPLNTDSISTYIPQLQARGVIVHYQ